MSRPFQDFLRRFAGIILVVFILLSTLVLLSATWLQSTVFSEEWYMKTFSNETYLTGLRTTIDNSLSAQAAYVGVPADILIKGVDDRKVYVLMRKHIENVTGFINLKTPFIKQAYPVESFSVPLLAYAQALSKSGEMTMSAEQDKLLLEISADSAAIVSDSIGIIDLSNLQKSSTFQKIHKALYRTSQLSNDAVWVLVMALVLLFVLFIHQIRRFLRFSLVGFWLAGVLVGIPLLVFQSFGLIGRLSITPAYVNFAVVQLLTNAVQMLMIVSLIILILASIALLVLFIWEHQSQEKWRRSGISRSNRERNRESNRNLTEINDI